MYIKLSTTTQDPSKKNAYIMGRSTYEVWTDDEKSNPKIFTVVTSNTLQ
jgi:dihydrofolate reductase